jgi:hypothetical protein
MAEPTDGDVPELTGEDLERQAGSPLPDREAMSTITGSGVDNFAVPINEAVAVNVESVSSYAIADADQIVILNQVDIDPDPDSGDETPDEGRPHPNNKHDR